MNPTSPAEFFDAFHQAYRQAEASAGGGEEHFVDVGGLHVCLRFAGAAALPVIMPALEHRISAPAAGPDLTVCIWDSISTRTPLPHMPWLDGDIGLSPRGDVSGYGGEHYFAHVGDRLLSLYDRRRRLGIFWMRSAAQAPIYVKGAPLHHILHWRLAEEGLQLIHAAAVGRSGRGVLMVGKGGSGKSTAALACLEAGLDYLSDDYCLLGFDPMPFAAGLYNTAKVAVDNLGRFPRLAQITPPASPGESEKRLFHIQRLEEGQPVQRLEICAVLLPRIAGVEQTHLAAVEPRQALAALALSTVRQLAGAGAAALHSIERLVELAPAFSLEMSADEAQIPAAVLGALEHLR